MVHLVRWKKIILYRVAGTEHCTVLKPGNRAKCLLLNLGRKTGREAVHVDNVGLVSFGLQKDLVTFPIGKPIDLVLDRWAVSRTHPLYPPCKHRRLIKPGLQRLMRLTVRVGEVHGDLWLGDPGVLE